MMQVLKRVYKYRVIFRHQLLEQTQFLNTNFFVSTAELLVVLFVSQTFLFNASKF